jgi:Type II site-specific deoxyribonuclease
MDDLFTEAFLAQIQSLVAKHHSLYPRIPPQGIFFESLVERAFVAAGWPSDKIVLTTPNSPEHDLLVGTTKLSVKTETGKGTRPNQISITKLCTTETGEWAAKPLIEHALAHLDRYANIFMLRAIWSAASIHYQLLDIPLDLLRLMKSATVAEVGKRPGRRSLAAHILIEGESVFRVHFDGADGKCQIHGLLVARCKLLREWDQPL